MLKCVSCYGERWLCKKSWFLLQVFKVLSNIKSTIRNSFWYTFGSILDVNSVTRCYQIHFESLRRKFNVINLVSEQSNAFLSEKVLCHAYQHFPSNQARHIFLDNTISLKWREEILSIILGKMMKKWWWQWRQMTMRMMNIVIDNDWWRWRQTSLKLWWRSIDDLGVIVNHATPWTIKGNNNKTQN